LARLSPVLGATPAWQTVVTGVGALTMVVATSMALKQTVLKPLLAYTTVGALGTMTMLIGIGTPMAIKAAMTFLLAHAFYKACLFLVAGVIDHETGEKDTRKLGGMRRLMPLTATAGVLAALSMAGLPPFFGFIGKEIVYEAVLQKNATMLLITALSVYASLFFLIVAFLTGLRPFLGTLRETPKHPHDPPASMWLGPVVLGGAGLFFGLLPGLAARWVVGPAASAVLAKETAVKLYLWHGINGPLLLSILTLLLAVAVYRLRAPILSRTVALTRLAAVAGAERVYFALLNGMLAFARWQTRMLQNGRLRYYMMVVTGFTLLLVGYSMLGRGMRPSLSFVGHEWRPYELLLGVLMIASILAAIRAPSRLGGIAALGVVGYGVAVIFVLFGAPDLAMTQVVIETLTLVLLVLAFYHLPSFTAPAKRHPLIRVRDLTFAIGTGVVMTLLVLFAIEMPFHPTISDYFLANAVDGAHGRNIVNVILVDFRAVDTLGEITVLALAGIGGYALLKLKLNARREPDL
jgi:multicomponent Na+:H+ antiporter subunit A